jgi:hypothetical protein
MEHPHGIDIIHRITGAILEAAAESPVAARVRFGQAGHVILSLLLIFCCKIAAANEPPCAAVNRSLSGSEGVYLNSLVSRQIGIDGSEVKASFKIDSWRILYVETHQSDEVYLFYKQLPSPGNYVGMWSGAARSDETLKIMNWTLLNIPGIPPKLAECFAWIVTNHVGF